MEVGPLTGPISLVMVQELDLIWRLRPAFGFLIDGMATLATGSANLPLSGQDAIHSSGSEAKVVCLRVDAIGKQRLLRASDRCPPPREKKKKTRGGFFPPPPPPGNKVSKHPDLRSFSASAHAREEGAFEPRKWRARSRSWSGGRRTLAPRSKRGAAA